MSQRQRGPWGEMLKLYTQCHTLRNKPQGSNASHCNTKYHEKHNASQSVMYNVFGRNKLKAVHLMGSSGFYYSAI